MTATTTMIMKAPARNANIVRAARPSADGFECRRARALAIISDTRAPKRDSGDNDDNLSTA